MKSLEIKISMELLYKTIGKSRQDFHQSKKRQIHLIKQVSSIIELVNNWRINHPRMGSRTLYYSMIQKGINLPVGVNKFEKILSENALTVGRINRSGPYTSDGKGKSDHDNLTNGLVLTGVNQLVVADITYQWVQSRWFYLFTLKDVYSQRLISLIPSTNMKAENVKRTLLELKTIRGKEALQGCIHHSDNGSQYESEKCLTTLADLEMQVSRAEVCQQNGSSEQLNHIIKNMYLKHMGIATFGGLQKACKRVKHLMNQERSISQLGNMTVANFEKNLQQIPQENRVKKRMYDFENDT